MLKVKNFSENFSEVKKIYYHEFKDHRGIFKKIYKNEIFSDVLQNIDEIFENEPLTRLAKNKNIYAYKHDGFFRPLDTYRELIEFNNMWKNNQAPWNVN